VAHHKYTLMETLGLETNADLVRFAVRNGLVAE
jgi:DNA-binding NarL/FixJ family response regulator